MSINWTDFVPDNEFVPPVFQETRAINRIHSFPRFGYPSDISYVASENDEEKFRYFYGAAFVSSIIVLVFLVWNIFLILLRMAGYDRIGVISGAPPYLPYPSENAILSDINHEQGNGSQNGHQTVDEATVKEIEEWQKKYQRARNTMDRTRVFFIISACIAIVASFVIYVSGLAPLESSFIAVRDEVKDLQDLIIASREQMGDQYLSSMAIIPKRDSILEEVITWCPNVETNFSVSHEAVSKDQAEIILDSDGNYVAQVGNLRTMLEESYANLSNMIASGAQSVARSLVSASENAEEVEDGMTRFIFWYGLSMFFIVAIDVLALILLAGVYASSRANPSSFVECIQVRLILPLFTLFVNAAWIIAAIFAVIGVLSADMCTGSPEKNIIAIFHEKEQTMDSLLYGMTKYYVEQCMSTEIDETEKPTIFIDDFENFVVDSMLNTDLFVTEINFIEATVIDTNCGESIEDLSKNLTDFRTELKEFQQTVTNSSSSLSCSVFTPTYADIMHEQICYRAVDSLSVIFIMLLLITLSGMVMITLRVAVKGIEFEEEDYDDEDLDLEESFVVTGREHPDERKKRIEKKNRELDELHASTSNEPDHIHNSKTIDNFSHSSASLSKSQNEFGTAINKKSIQDDDHDDASEADLDAYPLGVLSTDNDEIEVSLEMSPPSMNPEIQDQPDYENAYHDSYAENSDDHSTEDPDSVDFNSRKKAEH